jgi:hypothetical protein
MRSFSLSTQCGNSEAVCNTFVVVSLCTHLASSKLRLLIGRKCISAISAKNALCSWVSLAFCKWTVGHKTIWVPEAAEWRLEGERKISIEYSVGNLGTQLREVALEWVVCI